MPLQSFNLKGLRSPITRLSLGGAAIGGYGWGKRDDHSAIRTILTCLENGISFFDTADVYGLGNSEVLFGKAFKEFKADGERICLATKGGVAWHNNGKTFHDSSPTYLAKALERSLKRLQVDKVSLYYLHWQDSKTPIEESLSFLLKMKEQGKIGAIGVCNLNPKRLEDLGQFDISAIQFRANLLEPFLAYEYFNVSRKLNCSLISYSSLADGLLAGKITEQTKFTKNDHRRRYPLFLRKNRQIVFKKIRLLGQLAKSIGCTPGQFSLRWLLEMQIVDAVLFGAKTPEQARELLKCEAFKFGNQDLVSGSQVSLKNKSPIKVYEKL